MIGPRVAGMKMRYCMPKAGMEHRFLGPRILRTETVGIALLAAIMFYSGEMDVRKIEN